MAIGKVLVWGWRVPKSAFTKNVLQCEKCKEFGLFGGK